MFTWEDAFRIATTFLAMFVASIGGVGVLIRYGGKMLADRLAENHRRETETMLTEMRGRLDEGLSRLNAALQHQNFVLQRLAEIELNGIHSCWRAAVNGQVLLNGVRPVDCGTDPDALLRRIKQLADAHNTLLTLIGKYDPFLDPRVPTILHEIARILRLEISQAGRDSFTGFRWWEQGTENAAALETQITGLRAAVQIRIAALRQVADEGRRRSSSE